MHAGNYFTREILCRSHSIFKHVLLETKQGTSKSVKDDFLEEKHIWNSVLMVFD